METSVASRFTWLCVCVLFCEEDLNLCFCDLLSFALIYFSFEGVVLLRFVCLSQHIYFVSRSCEINSKGDVFFFSQNVYKEH